MDKLDGRVGQAETIPLEGPASISGPTWYPKHSLSTTPGVIVDPEHCETWPKQKKHYLQLTQCPPKSSFSNIHV